MSIRNVSTQQAPVVRIDNRGRDTVTSGVAERTRQDQLTRQAIDAIEANPMPDLVRRLGLRPTRQSVEPTSQGVTVQGITAQGIVAPHTSQGITAQGVVAPNTSQGVTAQGVVAPNTSQGVTAQGIRLPNTSQGVTAQGLAAPNTSQGVTAQGLPSGRILLGRFVAN